MKTSVVHHSRKSILPKRIKYCFWSLNRNILPPSKSAIFFLQAITLRKKGFIMVLYERRDDTKASSRLFGTTPGQPTERIIENVILRIQIQWRIKDFKRYSMLVWCGKNQRPFTPPVRRICRFLANKFRISYFGPHWSPISNRSLQVAEGSEKQ